MLSILNTQNNAGNTALHWAALNGHLESVKVLLDHGSDPTITNQRGHDAVFEAELNDKQNVVEWVLKEGGAGLEAGIAGEIAEGEAEGDGDEETDNMDEDVADDELSKQVAKELGQLGLEGKGHSWTTTVYDFYEPRYADANPYPTISQELLVDTLYDK